MKRVETKLIFIVGVPVLLIVAGILFFALGSSSLFHYKQFKMKYAESMAYAQDNNCLRAEYSGPSVRISTHNATGIYTEVVNGGILFKIEDIPSTGGILLDFGNGDRMQLWSGGKTGILVYYSNTEGYSFYYRTRDSSRFISLERLVNVLGSAGPNALWDADH